MQFNLLSDKLYTFVRGKFEEGYTITISKWKAELLENVSSVFSGQPAVKSEDSPEFERLYAQIGQLKVELDFLKKSARKLGIPQTEWKP
jgi:hypothetical protein